MTATLANTRQFTTRHLRAMSRQPYYIAITLVQPIIWLLLFGSLFKRVVDLPGFGAHSYIGFLTPGVVVMTALFSNGWSGMGIINDIDRGVMDRFLVTPARRGSLIGGILAYQGVTTVIQAVIIIVLGLAAGARFHGGPLSLLAFLVATVLLGSVFASFSNALALVLRKEESVIAAVQFVVLPLSFLSSAFMPTKLVPHWIQVLAKVNPVNWAVQAGRQTLGSHVDWAVVATRTGELAVLAVACAWLSVRAFRSYQRSV